MRFYKIIGLFSKIDRKDVLGISLLAFFLIFPNIFYLVHVGSPISLIFKYSAIAFLFLLNPLVFFYKNIKIYLYTLSFFAVLVPLVCFSIYLFDLKIGARLVGLVFQTNLDETIEITQGYRAVFIFLTLLFILVYFFCVKRISVKRVPFFVALLISLVSTIVVWGKMFQLKRSFHVLSMYGILDEYYPISVVSSTMQVLLTAPNNLDKAKGFVFHSYKTDSLADRQIYVLIIGESSRYDHWGINGYSRKTSPRLLTLNNIISFSDVASGAHFTWLSVPQLITRATPENMGIQYTEKSILSAFREAGFETIWLSNQEPDYYTGSFTLHAETADVCLFPDAKELSHGDSYDGRYLPIMDSILRNTNKNLFLVFHTMGSHWDYSKRYPESFDYFKPSGKTATINPPKSDEKEAIINSYDNSIRYSDFIVDSIIHMAGKYDLISYVTFISDHGEDLFDRNENQLNFHLTASKNTLHIPLFIWTSNKYNAVYPLKRAALINNKNRKVGENDVFYTLLDMANIRFPHFDSTKSLSSTAFIDSQQEYIEQGGETPKFFSDLPE